MLQSTNRPDSVFDSIFEADVEMLGRQIDGLVVKGIIKTEQALAMKVAISSNDADAFNDIVATLDEAQMGAVFELALNSPVDVNGRIHVPAIVIAVLAVAIVVMYSLVPEIQNAIRRAMWNSIPVDDEGRVTAMVQPFLADPLTEVVPTLAPLPTTAEAAADARDMGYDKNAQPFTGGEI